MQTIKGFTTKKDIMQQLIDNNIKLRVDILTPELKCSEPMPEGLEVVDANNNPINITPL